MSEVNLRGNPAHRHQIDSLRYFLIILIIFNYYNTLKFLIIKNESNNFHKFRIIWNVLVWNGTEMNCSTLPINRKLIKFNVYLINIDFPVLRNFSFDRPSLIQLYVYLIQEL